jgi:hypothetical protein
MTEIEQLIDILYKYALEQKQNDKMTLIPFEMRWTCPLCREVIIHKIGNIPPKYCCNIPQSNTKDEKG